MSVKSKTKNFVYFFLNRLNWFWRLLGVQGLPILMYHSVADNKVFFTVKPADFEWQINYLVKNGYNSIFVKDLIKLLSGKKIPEKTVAITLDDGYEDIYLNAFPVLKKHNLKATLFLTTGYVGSEMNNSQGQPLKMLTWQQIEEMHESSLIDFQPHSSGHYDLDRVTLDETEHQILQSRRVIESRLNKECKLFAYPRGKYNQALIEMLKRNSFEAAVVVKEGVNHSGADLFRLKRNSIDSSITKEQFIGKIGYSVELFNETFKWWK